MTHWYVYVIYESPAKDPYHVKVGYSHDPLRRLNQLQAGNPRILRAPNYSTKPVGPFGFRFDSKEIAAKVEADVHEKLRAMGVGLMSDYDYEKQDSHKREWFEGIHPESVWDIVVEVAVPYVKR